MNKEELKEEIEKICAESYRRGQVDFKQVLVQTLTECQKEFGNFSLTFVIELIHNTPIEQKNAPQKM